MKVRKPSLKKSISARTTGKLKRSVKKATNPLYGKKGMGFINNPKKAVYNAVYNKTTVSINPYRKANTSPSKGISFADTSGNESPEIALSPRANKLLSLILVILGVVLLAMSLLLLIVEPLFGTLGIIGAIFAIVYGRKTSKKVTPSASSTTDDGDMDAAVNE